MDSTSHLNDRYPPCPGKLAGLLILEFGIGRGFLDSSALLVPDGCQRDHLSMFPADGLHKAELHAITRNESSAMVGPEQEYCAMRWVITDLSLPPTNSLKVFTDDPNRHDVQVSSADPDQTIERSSGCARTPR